LAPLLVGSAHRLAIDSDCIRRHASYCRNPSHEAVLEFLGVEHRQNIAEAIV
jgi:hypothetical protein